MESIGLSFNDKGIWQLHLIMRHFLFFFVFLLLYSVLYRFILFHQGILLVLTYRLDWGTSLLDPYLLIFTYLSIYIRL